VTPGLEIQGQWAGAGAPVELFTIGALDPLWVLGDVYEMDLPHVKKGLPVQVRVPAFPDRTFRGRIDWVSDVLDPATRTAKVRCAIENPERLLRPEMAPVLSIGLPSHHHVAVPRDALLRLGDDTVVFVASTEERDGQLVFRRRKVVAGEDGSSGLVPILDGLAPGERVVVSGGIFLVGLL
jgi:multidrug efflux pump subunit AcrA (membrane-fusion protein)